VRSAIGVIFFVHVKLSGVQRPVKRYRAIRGS